MKMMIQRTLRHVREYRQNLPLNRMRIRTSFCWVIFSGIMYWVGGAICGEIGRCIRAKKGLFRAQFTMICGNQGSFWTHPKSIVSFFHETVTFRVPGGVNAGENGAGLGAVIGASSIIVSIPLPSLVARPRRRGLAGRGGWNHTNCESLFFSFQFL